MFSSVTILVKTLFKNIKFFSGLVWVLFKLVMANILLYFINFIYIVCLKFGAGKEAIKENSSIKEDSPAKEGGGNAIWIKIYKGETNGYSAFVYNRHGIHLTKENSKNFVKILKLIIDKEEEEIKNHKFKLYIFNKDK